LWCEKHSRARVGKGTYALASTRSLAPGFLQANVTVVPARLAADFVTFCLRNPRALPLLDVCFARDGFASPRLAPEADVLKDVPWFRVTKQGRPLTNGSVRDPAPFLSPGSVAVLTGCSFSFEDDLVSQGLWRPHPGRNVPMFRTRIANAPCGPFAGNLVVSMRWIRRDNVARVRAVTSAHAISHGAPLDDIDPAELNLARPDYGDANDAQEPDCQPVFWACGVTAQAAVGAAVDDAVATHSPGHMFIADVRSADANRVLARVVE